MVARMRTDNERERAAAERLRLILWHQQELKRLFAESRAALIEEAQPRKQKIVLGRILPKGFLDD
jgi:hypothetical protein